MRCAAGRARPSRAAMQQAPLPCSAAAAGRVAAARPGPPLWHAARARRRRCAVTASAAAIAAPAGAAPVPPTPQPQQAAQRAAWWQRLLAWWDVGVSENDKNRQPGKLSQTVGMAWTLIAQEKQLITAAAVLMVRSGVGAVHTTAACTRGSVWVWRQPGAVFEPASCQLPAHTILHAPLVTGVPTCSWPPRCAS